MIDVFQISGTPRKATKRFVVSDTSATFSATDRQDSQGKEPIAAIITAETNDVRYAFNTAAVNTSGSEVGHVLIVDSGVRLANQHAIENFNYINAVAAADGVLQVTFEY